MKQKGNFCPSSRGFPWRILRRRGCLWTPLSILPGFSIPDFPNRPGFSEKAATPTKVCRHCRSRHDFMKALYKSVDLEDDRSCSSRKRTSFRQTLLTRGRNADMGWNEAGVQTSCEWWQMQWLNQWLKCNRTQGNAVPPPTENGLKRSPTSVILWTQGNSNGYVTETECGMTVYTVIMPADNTFLHFETPVRATESKHWPHPNWSTVGTVRYPKNRFRVKLGNLNSNQKFTEKMTKIDDGHIGIWARQARHVMTWHFVLWRDKWNFGLHQKKSALAFGTILGLIEQNNIPQM